MKFEPISPPQIAARRLPPFDSENWDSIDAAFKAAQSCPLRQAWRSAPEPGFRPGSVRMGWSETALLVYAELEDEDIFNPLTELNALSFKQGDVFEIFLRPVDQPAYFEFHVTPQNQKLQLRFPTAEAVAELRAAKAEIPKEWKIYDWILHTRVEVCPCPSKWRVFAEMPFDRVAETRRPGPGSQWLFSFSRYDYTRGKEAPVLSSSSPHRVVDFHRQPEWGSVTFGW